MELPYLKLFRRALAKTQKTARLRVVRGRVSRLLRDGRCRLREHEFYEFAVTHIFVNDVFQPPGRGVVDNRIVLVLAPGSGFRGAPQLSCVNEAVFAVAPLEDVGCLPRRMPACRCRLEGLTYWRVVAPLFCARTSGGERLIDLLEEWKHTLPGYLPAGGRVLEGLKPWLRKRRPELPNRGLMVHLRANVGSGGAAYYHMAAPALMMLVGEGSVHPPFGLVVTLFGLGALDLPARFFDRSSIDELARKLTLTRFDMMSVESANLLLISSCLEPAQRAVLYPLTWACEDREQLGNSFANYVPAMEHRLEYQRQLLLFDSPLVCRRMAPEFETGCAQLEHLLRSDRVTVHAAVHLPTQVADLVFDDYPRSTFVCPNRGLQLWLMGELQTEIPFRFEDLVRRCAAGDWAPPRRLVVLWAHMLGIQQWLFLAEHCCPAGEVVFVCSYFGVHVRSPCEPGIALFLDTPGYGSGDVLGELLRNAPELVKVSPPPTRGVSQARQVCDLAFRALSHELDWVDAHGQAMELLLEDAEDEVDRTQPGFGWSADDPLRVYLGSNHRVTPTFGNRIRHAFVSHQSGEVFVRAVTCDQPGTFHVCQCHARGVAFCQPNLRFKSHIAPSTGALPDRQRTHVGCLTSDRPHIAAHLHVLLDIQVETGLADPLPLGFYAGFPAHEVVGIAPADGISLIQLARLATQARGRVALLAPSRGGPTPPLTGLGTRADLAQSRVGRVSGFLFGR